MTKSEFSVILTKISRFYPRFYEGQDAEKIRDDWYQVGGFDRISFELTDRAVTAYCNTAKFPPTLADIKAQMVESYLQDKPTAMQAFQRITQAVKKSTDRENAAKQYNELPPILRKLVDNPATLRDWNQVSPEVFQTVIMSAIRESYKELATREAKYYAYPEQLQRIEQWRIEAPEQTALPEPKKPMTIDEMFDVMDQRAVEYRKQHEITANPAYSDRVGDFLKPMTDNEVKELEAKKRHKEAVRMQSW